MKILIYFCFKKTVFAVNLNDLILKKSMGAFFETKAPILGL